MRRIRDDRSYWRRTAVMVLARVRLGLTPRELAPLFGVGVKQIERLLRSAPAQELRTLLNTAGRSDDYIVGDWLDVVSPDSPF